MYLSSALIVGMPSSTAGSFADGDGLRRCWADGGGRWWWPVVVADGGSRWRWPMVVADGGETSSSAKDFTNGANQMININ